MIQLILSNIFTKVTGAAGDKRLVGDLLRYQVQGWQAIKANMRRRQPHSSYWRSWDGTKSFFNAKESWFLAGLISHVTSGLKRAGKTYEVIDARTNPVAHAPRIPSGYKLNDTKRKFITLRDYQVKAVNDFLKAGRGTAKLATAAGKTECAIALTAHLGVPTIFLTHRVNLLYQTAQRFAERLPARFRNRVGIIGDGNWSPDFVTVATVQTLFNQVKKDPKALLSELQHFNFLIIDEAHRAGASQFHETAKFCPNAYYRLALTATPFMKGNTADDLYLMGTTGPIVTQVTNGELIKRGILARPFFTFFDVHKPGDLSWLKNWRDIYEKGIVNNKYRNNLIGQQAKKMTDSSRKTLCIVAEVKHGRQLAKVFADHGIKAKFMHGEKAYADRAKALKELSQRKIQAIIATNIFDEGINVQDINAVILAGGNKSAPALFQRTGRAMRKKPDNYCIVIDFIDRQHEKLFAHSKTRYEIVKNEKGFTIL